MKKTLFLLVTIVFILILSGCTAKVNDLLLGDAEVGNISVNSTTDSNGDNIAGSVKVTSETSTVISSTPAKKVVQKFYPEGLSPKPVIDEVSPSGNAKTFSVTQEFQVKLYLIDKYKPGVCYGLPGPIPQVAIDGMIEDNPDLVKFLRTRYSLKTDLDVYKKIKQINGIYLVQDKGSYIYEFTDGQCCTLHTYQGKITIVGANITDAILEQQTKTNPC